MFLLPLKTLLAYLVFPDVQMFSCQDSMHNLVVIFVWINIHEETFLTFAIFEPPKCLENHLELSLGDIPSLRIHSKK